jgi:hypothetical protein
MKRTVKPENPPEKKRPTHAVYVVDGEGDTAFWTKIGGAWPHEDGEGFNLVLTAFPLHGRLVVRKPKPKADDASAG